MKYAKSEKGYYVPKSQKAGEPKSNDMAASSSAQAPVAGEPVTTETSLSFKDANYVMTKDRYGNDLYVPAEGGKSGLIDYQAAKGEALHMKAVGYKKLGDGTFEPVVYDMNSGSIDDRLTKEIGVNLSQGMRLEGGNKVKGEDVAKLLYKNAISSYQYGPMKKMIDKAAQEPGKVNVIPAMGPGTKFDVQ